jgi:type IV secretion system protein VirB9
MKKTYLLLLPLAALFSCASVDMEKRVKAESGAGRVPANPPVLIAVPVEPQALPPPVVVEIERPVFIPEERTGTARTTAAAAGAGRAAVEASNRDGIKRPEDYSHAAMVYDFNPDWVYEVYCMPLRAGDIRLEPGERAVESPFVADSERWMLGAGVSQENGLQTQHIYVKPTAAGISASLIINTDRRVYHLILRSFSDIHMPLVYWKYPYSGLPFNFTAPAEARQAPAPSSGGGGDAPAPDPRFLSFNYKITYGLFKKPKWLPRHVYDDGSKTYIEFNRAVAQSEMPGIYENRNDVLNYRVYENVIVIDRLIEEITVRLGDREITVRKKNG